MHILLYKKNMRVEAHDFSNRSNRILIQHVELRNKYVKL